MGSGTRAVYHRSFNKIFSPEFPVGFPGRYIPNEGRRAQWSKRWGNNDKYEENSVVYLPRAGAVLGSILLSRDR